MKILMTGATTLQIKPPEKRRANQTKIDVPGAVVDVLREAGHEVDWRAVRPGEDLSGYDLMWINLAGVLSMNSRPGAMGMLWAVAQTDVPAVLFLDDWKTRLTYQQAKSFSERGVDMYFDRHLITNSKKYTPDGQATHYTKAPADEELARLHALDPEAHKHVKLDAFYYQRNDMTDEEWYAVRDACVEGARLMREGRPNSAIGIPAYKWGDREIVRPTLPEGIRNSQLFPVDPSFIAVQIALEVFQEVRESGDDISQSDAWGLAALGDHTEWLAKTLPELQWPVNMVGHSTNRKLKSEHDVVRFYAENKGILSPSYYHAGSGWWRSRFIYAAMIGIPIFAADGEADALGPAYQRDAYDIESVSDAERMELASSQRAALLPRLSSREEFAHQVSWLVAQPLIKDSV